MVIFVHSYNLVKVIIYYLIFEVFKQNVVIFIIVNLNINNGLMQVNEVGSKVQKEIAYYIDLLIVKLKN